MAAVLLLGTRQAFTVPFTGLGLSTAQLILFLVVLAWVATRAIGHRAPAALGLLTALLVVRVACLVVSYGLAASRPISATFQSAADRAVVVELVAALTVPVLVTVLRTAGDVEWVLRGLVGGTALSAAFALVSFVGGPDIAAALHPPGFTEQQSVLLTALLREGLERPQGAAAHPLELGTVTAVVVPLAIGLAIAECNRGRRVWPWVIATAIIAAGGAVSLSRSTFVGIAVALIVLVPTWPVRRLAVAAGGVVVVAVVGLLAVPKLGDALSEILVQGTNDYSLESRADGRAYVWAHFADHFWFGQGPGTYDLATQKVLDNQYLSQLMESGVLGVLLFTAVLLCAFGYALRAARRDTSGVRPVLANAVAAAIAAAAVTSLVVDIGGFTQLFTLVWLLVGLAAALWRSATGGVTPAAAPAR